MTKINFVDFLQKDFENYACNEYGLNYIYDQQKG